jgi:para-aminobenzoate synthetase / 4-amino-4-deoxychorismate lyase
LQVGAVARFRPLPIDSLGPSVAGKRRFLLFDNALPSMEQRYSLLFLEPLRVHVCRSIATVDAFLDSVAREAKRYWIAGYLTYEASFGLEERLARKGTPRERELGWFGVYEQPYRFDHRLGSWTPPLPSRAAETILRQKSASADQRWLRPSIDAQEYARALRRVRNLIAAGDIYQANFTFDVEAVLAADLWRLYGALRERQPVPFGALLSTGTRSIVSLSPELFFIKQGTHIRTRPMKGTAPRGRFTEEDTRIATALAADEKNRSENVMIVDLLRNDLGKICVPGSVAVKELFAVERHPTLHQMTSTVEGHLRPDTDIAAIFKALFPCGSVTGAPKLRAMEILRELEKGERGVYCGAIGYASPDGRAVFSVPIRTLEKKRGASAWRYRVGSGIVWDSTRKAEWEECANKCSFLTMPATEFKIFESILFTKGKFLYLGGHKTRLFDAARYFGVSAAVAQWEVTAAEIRAALFGSLAHHKVRILLDKSGIFTWDHSTIDGRPFDEPQTILLAKTPVDSSSPFLFHKTTIRPWYAEAAALIARHGCFDVIHANRAGYVTEGSRCNLFAQINGTLYTPPVECGLLPGVLRGRLLRAGRCRERLLTFTDLRKAEELFCGNSVRGLVRVRVGERS